MNILKFIIKTVHNYLLDREKKQNLTPAPRDKIRGASQKKLLGSSKVLLVCVLKRLEARNSMHVLFPTAISHESQIKPDFCT